MSRSCIANFRARPGGRLAAMLAVTGVAIALTAGPVSATHTYGTLDCGTAGTFEVQAASIRPPGFEAPKPFGGLFLLEDTTRVFRAFTISTNFWDVSFGGGSDHPGPLVSCKLSAIGANFPWLMVGVLTP